jgi:hypothetical protein
MLFRSGLRDMPDEFQKPGDDATPPITASEGVPPIPRKDCDSDLYPEECNREFDRYEPERNELRKAELDAEKNYDNTISTLLGAKQSVWTPCLAVAWISFGFSLFVSLYHRKLTYETHKAWREILDSEFTQWHRGAWDRALVRYDTIPRIKLVEHLKSVGFWLLSLGLLLLGVFVFANYIHKETEHVNAQPTVATTSAPATSPVAASGPDAKRADSTSAPATAAPIRAMTSQPTTRIISAPATTRTN